MKNYIGSDDQTIKKQLQGGQEFEYKGCRFSLLYLEGETDDTAEYAIECDDVEGADGNPEVIGFVRWDATESEVMNEIENNFWRLEKSKKMKKSKISDSAKKSIEPSESELKGSWCYAYALDDPEQIHVAFFDNEDSARNSITYNKDRFGFITDPLVYESMDALRGHISQNGWKYTRSTKKSKMKKSYYVAIIGLNEDYETQRARSKERITDANNPPLRFVGGPNGWSSNLLGATEFSTIEEAQAEADEWASGYNGSWAKFIVVDDSKNQVGKAIDKSSTPKMPSFRDMTYQMRTTRNFRL